MDYIMIQYISYVILTENNNKYFSSNCTNWVTAWVVAS